MDLPLVGGKAFRLALLKQHGLCVPPGLVLTTAFFEAQLQHAQLVPLWAGSPDIAVTTEALLWLAEMLKTKPLAKELSVALNQALDGLFGSDTEQFAVRSSANDEDQRDHTFAGVHLTELGVPRSVLPIAITRCWASALDRPAIEYRQVHGMSIQGIRIAVLIQPMLSPHSAGVVLPSTRSPARVMNLLSRLPGAWAIRWLAVRYSHISISWPTNRRITPLLNSTPAMYFPPPSPASRPIKALCRLANWPCWPSSLNRFGR